MTKFISTKEAARKHNTTCNYISQLCRNGKVDGAVREGKRWEIPSDALNGVKVIHANGSEYENFMPLWNITWRPGLAVRSITRLHKGNRRLLLLAELDGCRCQKTGAELRLRKLANDHDMGVRFTAMRESLVMDITCGRVVKEEDIEGRLDAMRTSIVSEDDEAVYDVVYGYLVTSLFTAEKCPEWIQEGEIKRAPKTAKPLARYTHCLCLQEKQSYDKLLGTLNAYIDCSQAQGQILPEIYFRLMRAAEYRRRRQDGRALADLSYAASLSFEDGIILPFVKHKILLLGLDMTYLPQINNQVYKVIQAQWDKYRPNRGAAAGEISHKNLTLKLCDREYDVAYLAAHGFSNLEISQILILSENTVKSHMQRIYGKLE